MIVGLMRKILRLLPNAICLSLPLGCQVMDDPSEAAFAFDLLNDA
jgi:hypothetical protein